MKSKSKAVATTKKTAKAEAARKSRIRVLIADDHSVVREGLVSLFGDEMCSARTPEFTAALDIDDAEIEKRA